MRRNLQSLLARLDDPVSARALIGPNDKILVRAVESSRDRGDTAAQSALASEGVVEITRRELHALIAGLDDATSRLPDTSVGQGAIVVRAVDDDAHYRGRAPGSVWMPSSGEFR